MSETLYTQGQALKGRPLSHVTPLTLHETSPLNSKCLTLSTRPPQGLHKAPHEGCPHLGGLGRLVRGLAQVCHRPGTGLSQAWHRSVTGLWSPKGPQQACGMPVTGPPHALTRPFTCHPQATTGLWSLPMYKGIWGGVCCRPVYAWHRPVTGLSQACSRPGLW